MNRPASTPQQRFHAGDARGDFLFPQTPDGAPLLYLCGHSLGLQPRGAADQLSRGADAWEKLAVDGHFEGEHPWFELGEDLRPALGRLVGADAENVAIHGTLTTNLHLLLTSFYRPQKQRTKLLMEYGAFPSDRFLVRSHVRTRDLDPNAHVVEVRGEGPLSVPTTEEIIAEIERLGDSLCTVLLPGVAYSTGRVYDIARITAAAHAVGAIAGFDLAHAAGNVALQLQRDDVDFAAWCSRICSSN